MTKRHVTTAAHALAKTSKPVAPVGGKEIKVVDGLENVVAGLGSIRDKRAYTNWGFARVMSRMELDNMYRGSWLAKRIVNTVAEDMTREWLHVKFDDGGDAESAQESQFALEQVEKQFNVRGKTRDALAWARLYGGAAMVMGLNDTSDLSKPLNIEALGEGCLRYLHVLDRWRLVPSGVMETDLDSPNFGLPAWYMIAESAVKVHPSRILMFHGERLPYFSWQNNGMWHDSVLQHVVESLIDSETCNRAISTMMFEANIDVITAPGLTEVCATKEGSERLTKRYQLAALMKSFNRTLLLDEGEAYQKHQNSFANLDKVQQGFVIDVCGAADIPYMRLFGQSAAGFSGGDNDVRNYYDMLSSKQEADVHPNIDILYEILARHTFGEVPDDFATEFNPLWQVSTQEQATIDFNNAQRDQIYVNIGVLTEGVVAKELKERGTYRSITDEDVAMAEELAEANHERDINPPPPPPVVGTKTVQPPGAKGAQPAAPPKQGA